MKLKDRMLNKDTIRTSISVTCAIKNTLRPRSVVQSRMMSTDKKANKLKPSYNFEQLK